MLKRRGQHLQRISRGMAGIVVAVVGVAAGGCGSSVTPAEQEAQVRPALPTTRPAPDLRLEVDVFRGDTRQWHVTCRVRNHGDQRVVLMTDAPLRGEIWEERDGARVSPAIWGTPVWGPPYRFVIVPAGHESPAAARILHLAVPLFPGEPAEVDDAMNHLLLEATVTYLADAYGATERLKLSVRMRRGADGVWRVMDSRR